MWNLLINIISTSSRAAASSFSSSSLSSISSSSSSLSSSSSSSSSSVESPTPPSNWFILFCCWKNEQFVMLLKNIRTCMCVCIYLLSIILSFTFFHIDQIFHFTWFWGGLCVTTLFVLWVTTWRGWFTCNGVNVACPCSVEFTCCCNRVEAKFAGRPIAAEITELVKIDCSWFAEEKNMYNFFIYIDK